MSISSRLKEVFQCAENAEPTNYQSKLNGTLLWDYHGKKNTINNLYDLAQQKVWNTKSDIPWSVTVAKATFPSSAETEPLTGFPAYENLSHKEKIELCWWRHGIEVSEILHGEQAALIVSSQLVGHMPTLESKLFASSQVADEARHVDFFSRYLQEVAGRIHPPSPQLRTLIKTIVEEPRWDIKLIACQVLIESLAMARFQEIRQSTRVPLLATAIEYITKDEARHVKFGTEFLANLVDPMTAAEKEERAEFVLNNTLTLANAMNVYTRVAEPLGWDQGALRQHLRLHRTRHRQVGRNRFRQLLINLKSVGLLTQRVNNRLENIIACL